MEGEPLWGAVYVSRLPFLFLRLTYLSLVFRVCIERVTCHPMTLLIISDSGPIAFQTSRRLPQDARLVTAQCKSIVRSAAL
jgi:hypothetical protein